MANIKGEDFFQDTPGISQVPVITGTDFFGTQGAQKVQTPSLAEKIWSSYSTGVSKFSTGVAKGELSTVQGLGQLVLKGTDVLGITKDRAKSTLFESPEALKPEGVTEKIGYGAEKFAEFLIPATKAAKAEKAINVLSQGLKSPIGAAATRILGKAAVQGVAAGGVSLAQTGGDVKEAGKVAATAGIARAGFAIIGEGARALRIPERLYTTIFKNSKQEMLSELNSGGLTAMRQSNPEQYQKLVDAGVIKVGTEGTPLLNETLAEKALDRGLRGSIKNMANEIVSTKYESELNLQSALKSYQGTVKIPEKQFFNVLKEVAQEYENVGFGDITDEANRLAEVLKNSDGNVPAIEALQIRRLLDKLRFIGSYDKPVSKLSLSQANFKILSDELRPRINSIPGVQKIMNDYSFSIDALQALSEEAKRRGNSQVVSLIDSIFLGGAIIDPIPALTLGTLRRMILSGAGSTNIGSALANPNLGVPASAALQSSSAGAQSLLPNQE